MTFPRSRALPRTIVAPLVLSLVALLPATAPAASPTPAVAEEARLVGIGHVHGTDLEGYFLPGQLPCPGCPTIPLTIEEGSNVEFRGMDEEPHQVTAKKKRGGRPLFKSGAVKNGASTLMLTANLKPGVYQFFCFFHTDMVGTLEVAES